jgi:methyl-accepting chemotaxis protein
MGNLRIGVRLAIAFAAMLVITGAVAVTGYRGMARISSVTLEMLATDAEAARVADDARAQALELRRFEKDFLLNMGNAEKQASYHREWLKAEQALKLDLQSLSSLVGAGERDQLAKMARDLDVYSAGFNRVEEARWGAATRSAACSRRCRR